VSIGLPVGHGPLIGMVLYCDKYIDVSVLIKLFLSVLNLDYEIYMSCIMATCAMLQNDNWM
jgi:hypothetical protein